MLKHSVYSACRELADHMQSIYKAAFQASYLEEFMHESIGYHGTSNPQNSVLHDDMNYANAFKHFPITDICARGLAVLLSNKFTDMSSTTYSVRAIQLLQYSSYLCTYERRNMHICKLKICYRWEAL